MSSNRMEMRRQHDLHHRTARADFCEYCLRERTLAGARKEVTDWAKACAKAHDDGLRRALKVVLLVSPDDSDEVKAIERELKEKK